MPILRRAVLGVALVAAAMIAVPAVANADDGDGLPGCDTGEICLWYDNGIYYEKDFYYTGNDSGNMFMFNGPSGSYTITNMPVQDNALNITNKDTQCNVREGDLSNGIWNWSYFNNDFSEHFLGAVNNRNDRHERCV